MTEQFEKFVKVLREMFMITMPPTWTLASIK